MSNDRSRSPGVTGRQGNAIRRDPTGGSGTRHRIARRALSAALMLVTSVAIVGTGTGTGTRVIAAPSACPGPSYTAAAGDYWTSIARQAKVTLRELLAANAATAATVIHPGTVVCLPPSALPPSATPPSAPSAPAPAPSSAGPLVALEQFPVQGPCVFTDSFGAPRGTRTHEGVDIVAKAGQHVYAVRSGTLSKQYVDATLTGNGWRLTADDGTYFLYAHLSAFAEGLAVGSRVRAGQIIGLVGMTGDAGLPHLHFEVHPRGGAAINPTATVRAVDACAVTAVPAQPSGRVPGSTTPAGSPVRAATGSDSDRWQLINASVALETGGQRLVPGAVRTVKVAGLANVPAATTGVLARIQARNVAGAGAVVVQPCDGSPPPASASTMQVAPGLANAAVETVRVIDGNICVRSEVATDLRVEVIGYQSPSGVQEHAITPRRVLDTRTGRGPLTAGGSMAVALPATGADASTAALSVTVTIAGAASSGSIAIGPCGAPSWYVRYGAQTTQTFTAVLRTKRTGMCITTTATAHVVIDVGGLWSGPPS